MLCCLNNENYCLNNTTKHSLKLRYFWPLYQNLKGCLDFFLSSLITPHSIFVTPHSLLKIPQLSTPHPFGNYFHYTSLKYFNLFVGHIPELSVRPFCYFNRVLLPFTPSTKCLSHHSLPLLLAPKKSKLKKLKQRAKHGKQAPASIMRKVDTVALCDTCNSNIHSANPLAHRHEFISMEPFFAPPSWSPNRALRRVSHQIGWMKLGYGERVMRKRGSGFWWGFGEVAATRERVAATEDEVLWPCGWTCLWVWNPFLWPCK